ncbi:MAG: acyltransferase [Lentisphaerae bacterium]|jgi:acetyltransferase-like isoleucine patch superfamily enzyme|nr:acyltransferase [Lentisphaerota bacterium]
MWLLRWMGAGMAWGQKARNLCVQHYVAARLGQKGRGLSIGEGVKLLGPRHIRVGNDVTMAPFVILRAMTAYPWTQPPQTFSPEIVIGDNCFINRFSEISCVRRVVIGANTMIAQNCLIADHNHGYEDPQLSVRAQPLTAEGEVHIGADSWIGANCTIAGNVRVGRHCVIAAHSVVIHDIPDYSVAAGSPAKIIRQYDPADGVWRKMV